MSVRTWKQTITLTLALAASLLLGTIASDITFKLVEPPLIPASENAIESEERGNEQEITEVTEEMTKN